MIKKRSYKSFIFVENKRVFSTNIKGGDRFELENGDRFKLESSPPTTSAWLACDSDSFGNGGR